MELNDVLNEIEEHGRQRQFGPLLVKALRRAVQIIGTDIAEMAYQAIIEEREMGEIEKLPNSLQAKADTLIQELAAILSPSQKDKDLGEKETQ